jgi:hypothetical protein
MIHTLENGNIKKEGIIKAILLSTLWDALFSPSKQKNSP